jgi:hypothetical protein
MAGLMETLATSIHSIPFNDSHLPSLLRDEVILDLEDVQQFWIIKQSI